MNKVPNDWDLESNQILYRWTAVYNHAISALALSEAYGQCNAVQAKKLAPVIEKAIATTLEMQRWPGRHKTQKGGWRYLTVHHGFDSDLSVTGWQLMFFALGKGRWL